MPTQTTRRDPLSLDTQLCFALYRASLAIQRTYREKLDGLGLTYPQYLVLVVLWENDGQTLSDIGEALALDSGTLTPLLKRLEAQGLLVRRRQAADERQLEVRLTAKGKKLRSGALSAREHVACRIGRSERAIAELRLDLMDLVAALDA